MPSHRSSARKGIFISYASSDGLAYCTTLRERFERELPDFPVWRDIEDLSGGKRWWPQIEEALQSVECMVLLLTPGSLQSPYTTREWRFCRQNAVPVVPLPDVPLTDVEVPRWMDNIHWLDLETDSGWKKFTGQLHNSPALDRVPFMAPDPPDGFVDRPREFEQLISQVLSSDGGQPLAITTALHGAGGFGKTTLATGLCQDDRVIMSFVDGILWVTLGETPNVLAELSTVYAALTGRRPGFGTEFDASTALSEHLEHRRCLLVIDDVWNLAHLQPFLRGGPNCTRLITTRQVNIAVNARCEQPVLVDEMQPDEAVSMLGREEHPQHVGQLEQLARRLGEWPLMLELARGALRKRTQPPRSESFSDALKYVEKVLDRRGVTGLKVDDDASRQASISATMDISLEHLDEPGSAPHLRQAALELAVFAEDVDIPPRALEALWDVDDLEVEVRIDRLAGSSLLRLNSADGSIRLHDVVREYFGQQLEHADRVHARLVENWGDTHALPDAFAWKWIGYHLLEAEQADRLRELMFDPVWLDARIEQIHPNQLIADAERWMQHAEEAESSNSDTAVTAMRLLRDAIRLSSHLTADNPEQLPGQLVGRLNESTEYNPAVADFIKRVHSTRSRPCLLPRNSILNQAGGPLIRTLEGHSSAVWSVCVTPDGRCAVSASYDQTLKVWDLESGRELRTLSGHRIDVQSVCVTPDGRRAVSTSYDQTLKVWDLESGQELRTLRGHSHGVQSVCVTPDGRRVVSASDDQTLTVWDLESGQKLRTLSGHSDVVQSVCVTPDGRRAVSASSDETLRVWNLESGQEIRTLSGHSNLVLSVCVTPDGRRAVSASYDQTLKIWDLQSGRELRTLSGHSKWVLSVCVTPDGRRAVSASYDQTLKVWDLESGQKLRTLSGHSDVVQSVCVTPDGRRAVSASWDHTLNVWDLESGERVATFTAEGHFTSCGIGPDGYTVLAGEASGRVHFLTLAGLD